jgi:hypothetical protein
MKTIDWKTAAIAAGGALLGAMILDGKWGAAIGAAAGVAIANQLGG